MGFLERFLSSASKLSRGGLPRSRSRETLRDQVETWARRYGDRVALQAGSEQATFRQWNMRANRYARWARSESLRDGDVVGLASRNRIEALCAWAGLTKAGVTLALLDSSSSAEQLSTAIRHCRARRLIADYDLLKLCAEACDQLDCGIPIYGLGEASCAGAKAWARLELLHCGYSGCDIPFVERAPLSGDEISLLTIENAVDGATRLRGFDHRQIERSMARIVSISGLRKLDRIFINDMALNWAETIVATLAALSRGAACTFEESKSSEAFLDVLATTDATIFVAPACALRKAPGGDHRVDLPRSLRAGLIFGLTPDLADEWKAAYRRIPLRALGDIG